MIYGFRSTTYDPELTSISLFVGMPKGVVLTHKCVISNIAGALIVSKVGIKIYRAKSFI